MKLNKLWVLVLMVLVLAACAQAQSGDGRGDELPTQQAVEPVVTTLPEVTSEPEGAQPEATLAEAEPTLTPFLPEAETTAAPGDAVGQATETQAEIPITGEGQGTQQASQLFGASLSGPGGQALGAVNGLIVDVNTGRILWIDAAVGTDLGRRVLIPWAAVQNEPAGDGGLAVQATAEQIGSAPDFTGEPFEGTDSNRVLWDDATEDYWVGEMQDLIPLTVFEGEDSPVIFEQGFVVPVVDENEQPAGQVSDLLISADGVVEQVVVSGRDDVGTTSFTDWTSLGWDPDGQQFVIREEVQE